MPIDDIVSADYSYKEQVTMDETIAIDCCTWFGGEIRARLVPRDVDGVRQLGFLIFERYGQWGTRADPNGDWTRQLDYLSVGDRKYTCRIEEGKLRHYPERGGVTVWSEPLPMGDGNGAIHYRTWTQPPGSPIVAADVVSVFTGRTFRTQVTGSDRPPIFFNRGRCLDCDVCGVYDGPHSPTGRCICKHYNVDHL